MAASILAELLHARAIVNDDPDLGEGRFDWLLRTPDRRYAVEVTSHNEKARRAFDARTENEGGPYRELPDLPGLYFVHAEVTASQAKLWRTVPSLVRDHFPDGVGHHDLHRMRWTDDDPRQAYAQVLLDLGVLWITASQGTHSGMQITAEAGWWQDSSVVVDAAVSELDANRAKLANASGVDERHLFVWINPSAVAAHFSLRDEALPTDPVDLGHGIDVLWVAGSDASRRPAVVSRLWRVRSNEPWEDWTDQVRAN